MLLTGFVKITDPFVTTITTAHASNLVFLFHFFIIDEGFVSVRAVRALFEDFPSTTLYQVSGITYSLFLFHVVRNHFKPVSLVCQPLFYREGRTFSTSTV